MKFHKLHRSFEAKKSVKSVGTLWSKFVVQVCWEVYETLQNKKRCD